MATTAKTETPDKAETPARKERAKAEQPGVFLYIGPSIRGLIQENAIYTGKLSEIKARLADAIDRYPQINALIVPAESLAVCRREVKTSGTLLHKKYLELAGAE